MLLSAAIELGTRRRVRADSGENAQVMPVQEAAFYRGAFKRDDKTRAILNG